MKNVFCQQIKEPRTQLKEEMTKLDEETEVDCSLYKV
jgi:hypothetical protein